MGSVLLPVYNGEKYLFQEMKSINRYAQKDSKIIVDSHENISMEDAQNQLITKLNKNRKNYAKFFYIVRKLTKQKT